MTEWECGAVAALFTHRHGGVSAGPYASLNVAATVGDRAEAVQANRERVAAQAGVHPGNVHTARQVHGINVLDLSHGARSATWATPTRGDVAEAATVAHGAGADEGDAIVADQESGAALAVLVADCAPLVIAGATRFAVVHAGWRGLVAGVVERTLDALGEPALGATVGPAIGPCCFAVGEEVAAQFEPEHVARRGDSAYVDLQASAVARLRSAGVGRVDVVEHCTRCDERYFSYRGDGGTTGRQCVLAWMPIASAGEDRRRDSP